MTLHDDLMALRKKARADRHGYWFPLLLFGILSFASMPLYQPLSSTPEPDYYSYLRHDTGFVVPGIGYIDPLGMFNGSHNRPVEHATALGLYWLAVLVLGFLATVFWYRWRANRVGLETPTKAYVWATVVALAIPFVGLPVAAGLNYRFTQFLMILLWSPWVCVGVVFGSLALAAVALRGRYPGYRVLAVVFLLVTVTSAAVLEMVMFRGNSQFLVLAIGLLALAWVERNTLFGVVACAFTVAMLLANIYYMGNVYWRLGIPEFHAQDVLLPALILTVGGLVALVQARR